MTVAKQKLSDLERTAAAEIVAWFSVLVHGWQTGDLQAAAEAQRELAQQGVKVQIPRRLPNKKGDDANA